MDAHPKVDITMTQLAKLIIIFGAVLIVLGGLLWILGRFGFRGLPGDISYESERVKVYFPIVTCIVLSILLTLGLWLYRWFSQK
jgi:hypothetical protein